MLNNAPENKTPRRVRGINSNKVSPYCPKLLAALDPSSFT
jgi:hypothetical protein